MKITCVFIFIQLITTITLTANIVNATDEYTKIDINTDTNIDEIEIVDQEQTEDCGWYLTDPIGQITTFDQSFMPSMTPLTKIDLYLYAKPETSNLNVAIREKSDGENLIVISDFIYIDNSFHTDWVSFDIEDIDVKVESTYYIVIWRSDSSSSNEYGWFFSDMDPYSRGKGNGNWDDFCFRTYSKTRPPSKPDVPTGTTKGKAGIEYCYSSSTIEPDEEQLFFIFDWGDGTNSSWKGSYDSGQTAQASHTWNEMGEYNVKVKAKDVHGVESEWSDPLQISMPKNKPSLNPLFLLFLENHPHIFPLLRQLLGV